jgi:hypothetical protein
MSVLNLGVIDRVECSGVFSARQSKGTDVQTSVSVHFVTSQFSSVVATVVNL